MAEDALMRAMDRAAWDRTIEEKNRLRALLAEAVKVLEEIKDVQCPRGLQGGDITAARALEDIHDLASAALPPLLLGMVG